MASSSTSLPPLPPNYVAAFAFIDEAHAGDERKDPSGEVPYELHYARKMTRWLAARCPTASPTLQLACRAQHFRRWEIPRSSFPMNRSGYLTWRAKLKSQAAVQVAELLSSSSSPTIDPPIDPPIPEAEISRIAALVRKEGLAGAGQEEDIQILEDVACLVFLDDQFDGWEDKLEAEIDEEKMVGIVQKTWAKMSEAGKKIALGMEHDERGMRILKIALGGE